MPEVDGPHVCRLIDLAFHRFFAKSLSVSSHTIRLVLLRFEIVPALLEAILPVWHAQRLYHELGSERVRLMTSRHCHEDALA